MLSILVNVGIAGMWLICGKLVVNQYRETKAEGFTHRLLLACETALQLLVFVVIPYLVMVALAAFWGVI